MQRITILLFTTTLFSFQQMNAQDIDFEADQDMLHQLLVEYPTLSPKAGYIVDLGSDTIPGDIYQGKIEKGLMTSVFFKSEGSDKKSFTAHGIKAFGQVKEDGTILEYVSISMKEDEFLFYHKILEDEFTVYGCYKKNKDVLLLEKEGYIQKVDKWLKEGIQAYVAGHMDQVELFYHHDLNISETDVVADKN